jgi:hypothetical protein
MVREKHLISYIRNKTYANNNAEEYPIVSHEIPYFPN